jgi:Mor family transcriptional regulator
MPFYANAREALPRELLAQVQRHFEGGLLWIPVRARRRLKTSVDLERNLRIVRERRCGASTRFLAQKYGLSEERVRQIVKSAKRNS